MHATNIPAFLLLYPKRKALHRNGLEFIAQLLSLFGMIFKILHTHHALCIYKNILYYTNVAKWKYIYLRKCKTRDTFVYHLLLFFARYTSWRPNIWSHFWQMPYPYIWACLSTLTLLILTLSRMTLSKVSFSEILRNDYLDHFDTFGEKFDFDTFESIWVDRHPLSIALVR